MQILISALTFSQLPTIFLYDDVMQSVCRERGIVDEANLPFAKLCVCVSVILKMNLARESERKAVYRCEVQCLKRL
jgi:hypothetical protein